MGNWDGITTLFLFLLLVSQLSSGRATNERVEVEEPNVAINFKGVADFDYKNATVAFVSNSNVGFQLECNATYPIEWIIHYHQDDDGMSEHRKRAETSRIVGDFRDRSTYIYSSTLILAYAGKLLVLPNFSCQEVKQQQQGGGGRGGGSRRRTTHVLMDSERNKRVIILKITKGGGGGRAESLPIPVEDADAATCDSASATLFDAHSLSPCWTCWDQKNNKYLKRDFERCLTATECGSILGRQRKGRRCLKVVDDAGSRDPYCAHLPTADYNPKILICKNYGPALAQFYFFGVFQGLNSTDTSAVAAPIYFDWTEINPEEMLYMHPIPTPVYTGQELEVTCEYSRFYFALGSWFIVESEGGMKCIRGEDRQPCDSADSCDDHHRRELPASEKWRGTYKAVLKTRLDRTGLHRLSCAGPVWNSTEWVNASRLVTVQKGEGPKVVKLELDGNNKKEIWIGEVNRSLRCTFRGKPAPEVEWQLPNDHAKRQVEIIVVKEEEGYSQVLFSEVGFQVEGEYTCRVVSSLGQDSKSYHLRPNYRQLSTWALAAIILLSVAAFLLVAMAMGRMGVIIYQQRQQLRLLTDVEVREFLEGNPALFAGGTGSGSQVLDNSLAIDSLPYATEYEIPLDRLLIEYSNLLGSGQFGIVVKGKLLNSGAEQLPTEVAVKMCKKSVSVDSFKVVLAEVKVMAHLGSHPNLVTLVGVSTSNIRNREIFIAVEYCHNGSLKSFISCNKAVFVNMVKYGYGTFSTTSVSSPATTSPKFQYTCLAGNCDDDFVFSTLALFQWVSDIADGLAFMHDKGVIHGDLAIRNVLLSKELRAKVADFGLSRQLHNTSIYTKQSNSGLPWRHMAPESLKHLEFSPRSDMWAFGMTIWEMFAMGEVPYPGLTFSDAFVSQLEQGMRPPKPSYATNDIYDYMLLCWSDAPDERPRLGEIKELCGGIILKN